MAQRLPARAGQRSCPSSSTIAEISRKTCRPLLLSILREAKRRRWRCASSSAGRSGMRLSRPRHHLPDHSDRSLIGRLCTLNSKEVTKVPASAVASLSSISGPRLQQSPQEVHANRCWLAGIVSPPPPYRPSLDRAGRGRREPIPARRSRCRAGRSRRRYGTYGRSRRSGSPRRTHRVRARRSAR